MSLYKMRVSELELDGVDVIVENGNNPATHKADNPAAPTTTKVVAGRDLTIKAGNKVLKVALSKDGQHLEIEYLVKEGLKKVEPSFRLSL